MTGRGLQCPKCPVVAGSGPGLASHLRWHDRTDRLPAAHHGTLEVARSGCACVLCADRRSLAERKARESRDWRAAKSAPARWRSVRVAAAQLVPGDLIVIDDGYYQPLEVLDTRVDGDRVQLHTGAGWGRRWWVLASTMFVVRRRAR